MGLGRIYPARLSDPVQHLLALTGLRVGVGLRRLGDDPLVFPLTHGPLPSVFTLARSGTSSSRRLPDNANGERHQLVTAANVPRFHTPDGSGSRRGLLCEPERRNEVINTDSISGASWSDVGAPSYTGNDADDPFGTHLADLIYDNSAAQAEARMQENMGLVVSTAYAFSCFSRYFQYDGGGVWFFSGNIWGDSAHAGEVLTSDVGWKRLKGQCVAKSVNASSIRLYPGSSLALPPTASELGKMHYIGAQVEAGLHATTYIRAFGTKETRGGDIISISGSPITDRLSQKRGRLRSEWIAGFSAGEADVSDPTFFCITGTTKIVWEEGSSRFSMRGATGTANTAGGLTFAAGDVLCLDWMWDVPWACLVVYKNGVEYARATSTSYSLGAGGVWYIGTVTTGTKQPTGTFRTLIIG